MGIYLNSRSAFGMFRRDCCSVYFVDKTDILKELVPLVTLNNEWEENALHPRKGQQYIAITRPRRFGKTVMANMIASYFGKGIDSSNIFNNLKASNYPWYKKHLNQHNVIHIMFNEVPKECSTYEQYITRIEKGLLMDLRKAYPDAEIEKEDAVWDALTKVYEYCDQEQFIFVLDEWDYIYHQSYMTTEDKAAYTKFLSNLLKDKAYVELAYITGILPIAKYSSGSELNMFFEFSMATTTAYSTYFGFTDEEVDSLYQKYLQTEPSPQVTREGLELWYDGYQTASGKKLYNPRSVVGALTYNQLRSYWTSAGPYDEIFYYIGANVWKYYILHIPDLKLKSFVKFLQVFTMTNPFLTVLLPSLSRDSHSDVPPLFQMSDNPWLHCYPLYQKWHAEQQTEHGLSRPPER